MTTTAEYTAMQVNAMSESALQENVIRAAKVLGWRHYHTYSSVRSTSGFPDLVLVRRDRLIFAELKREKGKTSDAQKEWLGDLIESDRCEVYLWKPSEWFSGEIQGVLT